MAIILDTINLPDLVIDSELGNSSVDADVLLSLGGKPMVFERLVGGKYIDLVGFSDQAWIDRQTLVSLRALAAVPYSTYVLTYEGVTKTVRFRNEEQPVIEASPLLPRPNQAGTDWYNNVRIKLMEIE